jgi:hypothetical protein
MMALFLPAWSAMAQSPDPAPFYIGAYRFAPFWDDSNADFPVVRFVEGAEEVPDYVDRFTHLSKSLFTHARTLGLNLALPVLKPESVDVPLGPNSVKQIHDLAVDGDPMYLCLQDFTIQDFLSGERIMLHPESGLDFSDLGEFDGIVHEEFEDFPVDGAKLSYSVHPGAPWVGDNSVYMESGNGVISGLTDAVKLRLSMWNPTDGAEYASSGLYIVSAVLRIPEPYLLNDQYSDTPMMIVRIHSNESTDYSLPVTFTFTVRESDFFRGGSLVTEPLEIVLGFIEVRYNDQNEVVYILNRPDLPATAVNDAWTNTALKKYAKVIKNEEYHDYFKNESQYDPLRDRLANIDVEIEYGSSAQKFLLDAVCLSSPRSFAMFHPAHEIFDGTDLSVWSDTRADYERRLELCLTDGATPLQQVRFINGPESGLRSAFWPLVSVGQRLLHDIYGDDVMLYCALGYTEDGGVAAEFNRRFALGYYGYPLKQIIERPFLGSALDYHLAANRHDKRGFTEIARYYLKFAQERKDRPDLSLPWLPFIQNHSNLYFTTPPYDWWDKDELREPSAAELRYQCNMALAFGAQGVMFYALVSVPWKSADPFWPNKENDIWDPNEPLDKDCGELGFLDTVMGSSGLEYKPRATDWNGEDKFALAEAYIRDELQPLGEYIASEGLVWQRSKIWHLKDLAAVNAGTSDWVTAVRSLKPAAAGGDIDDGPDTYVITSEFTRADGMRYVLVVNGRTHADDSERHIRVMLNWPPDFEDQWVAQNILSKESWRLIGTNLPDTSRPDLYSFGEMFQPGQAALYRLRPSSSSKRGIEPPVNEGDYTIGKLAVLDLEDVTMRFLHRRGLYVEGTLLASNTEFTWDAPEEHWDGIFARNGGKVTLTNGSRVIGGRAGAGPGSTLLLDEQTVFTEVCDTCAALNALGGVIVSAATVAQVPDSGAYLAAWYGAEVTLAGDSTYTIGVSNGGMGIFASGADVTMTRTRLYDQRYGVSARDLSLLRGWDSWADPGLNRVRSDYIAFELETDAIIDIGYQRCARNSAHVEDIDGGYHIVNNSAGLSMLADSVYWSHGPTQNLWPKPKTTGSGQSSVADPLLYDPVPFVSWYGGMSKSVANTSRSWRSSLGAAGSRDSRQEAGNLVSMLLNDASLSPALVDYAEAAYWTKRLELDVLRDSLLLALLSRQDMESKLLAADMAAADGHVEDALSILNAYSFAGSASLLARGMLRKAALHPLAGPGGYMRGLAALDSVRSLPGLDRRYRAFFELYPTLYRDLWHATGDAAPKRQSRRLLDAAIPEGVRVLGNYPNPFSSLTSLTVTVPEGCMLRLSVHDMLGRELATLREGYHDRGVYSVVFDAGQLPNGMYLYRLRAGETVLHGRMLLLR